MLGTSYHYRYAAITALQAALSRGDSYWLSEEEQSEYAALRNKTRRQTWFAGRVLCKQLLTTCLRRITGLTAAELSYPHLRIESAGYPPRAWYHDQPIPWSISLSHTSDSVLAAVASQRDLSVGVDLVKPQTLNAGFQEMWFTPAERYWMRDETAVDPSIVWGMKEAVYKALRGDSPFAPRSIEIQRAAVGGFRGCHTDLEADGSCRIWWRGTRHNEIAIFATSIRGACHD